MLIVSQSSIAVECHTLSTAWHPWHHFSSCPCCPPPPPLPGDILKVVKDATQRVYDREKLMHMAFDEIGSLKMGQISDLRVTNQVGAVADVYHLLTADH